jgi:diguanylate cyclase (GGDEF)-like protein
MHREGLRHLILDYIENADLEKPSRASVAALLLVDIDRFSELNRALGLLAADRVLAACARWLETQIRSVDLLARFDGARFVIWMPDASQRFEVVQLAQRLMELKRVEIDQSGAKPLDSAKTESKASMKHVEISLSVSCAFFPEHGRDFDALAQATLHGLQVTKQSGGGRVQLANQEAQSQIENPNAWSLQNDLSAALVGNNLDLVYQPIYRLFDRQIIGAEALLGPRVQLLASQNTESMMEVAEKLPVIEQLTRWGLFEACQTAALMCGTGQGNQSFSIAVNLPPSVMQLPALASWVQEALTKASVPANLITLEMTERGLVQGDSLLIHTMQALDKMGCGLAMDDFGIGYTALAQWVRLPIKKVKFDRSLMPSSYTDTRAIVLLKHLIALAGELSITTVAEGVEHEWQWDLLKTLGCDQAQGYLLSRPISVSQLKLLATQAS